VISAALEAAARWGYLGDVVVLTMRMRPIDRSLALASKLFVAIIPLSIIVSALVPSQDSFGESVVRTFHLSGEGARATATLFATSGRLHGAISLVGIGLVLYSMLGYARGLQQVYLDGWEVGPLGVEGWWRRALWIAGYTLYLGIAAPLQQLERRAGLDALLAVTPLALGFLLALWGPWALVGSRIPWRRLLPTAAVTATGHAGLLALSVVFVPPVFTAAAERYGVIGVACAIVTWLFFSAFVTVMAAIVTIAWDRRRHGPPITVPVG
jgi:membrane protein